MRVPRKFLQDATTLLILYMAAGAFEALVVDTTDQRVVTNGSPLMWLTWGFIYIGITVRLIPRYREVVALVRTNKFLFSLVLFAILSTVWSQDPGLTFRRSVALLGTTFIGIDFSVRYSVREQLRLLYLALGLFVVFSIVAQVFFPSLIPSLDSGDEAWHGIASHKNTFGKIVVLAAVAMLCRSRRLRMDTFVVAALLIVAFALVVLADSMSALVILAAMLVSFGISGALRWRPKMLYIAFVASAVIAIPMIYFLFQHLEGITALLGRDPTLTGRVRLWQLSLSSIASRPICGYGYIAFWSASSQEAMRIRGAVHWAEAPHSHNGFIDLTLGMGFLGLFLYLAGYAVAMRRAIRCFRQELGREAAWPVAYLMFTFLYQLSETSIVAPSSIFWTLYIAAACSVSEVRYAYGGAPTVGSQAAISNTGLDVIRDYA